LSQPASPNPMISDVSRSYGHPAVKEPGESLMVWLGWSAAAGRNMPVWLRKEFLFTFPTYFLADLNVMKASDPIDRSRYVSGELDMMSRTRAIIGSLDTLLKSIKANGTFGRIHDQVLAPLLSAGGDES